MTERETIRQMLTKRYHGAIEITDEMIDMVLENTEEHAVALDSGATAIFSSRFGTPVRIEA